MFVCISATCPIERKLFQNNNSSAPRVPTIRHESKVKLPACEFIKHGEARSIIFRFVQPLVTLSTRRFRDKPA